MFIASRLGHLVPRTGPTSRGNKLCPLQLLSRDYSGIRTPSSPTPSPFFGYCLAPIQTEADKKGEGSPCRISLNYKLVPIYILHTADRPGVARLPRTRLTALFELPEISREYGKPQKACCHVTKDQRGQKHGPCGATQKELGDAIGFGITTS